MRQAILAVDDDPHMLKLLEKIIVGKTPYDIETVENSLEVPRMLEAREYDLIITDLKMPGLSGLDILRFCRQNRRAEETIVITAFAELETALEAMSLGAGEYITKPFRKERLLLAVDGAMRRRSRRRELDARLRAYELEPFELAVEAFRGEYVRMLAQRSPGGTAEMAQRSGIPATMLDVLLKKD